MIPGIIFTSPQLQYSQGVDQTIRLGFWRIPSPQQEASIRPWTNEYHLQIMRQVFVRWTNTLSKTRGKYSSHGQIPSPKQGDEYPLQHLPKTWGKYSSHGRIPSPKYGASIRPMDEYPLQHMGQAFVLWTNTPTRNLGQVLTRGRVVPIRRMDLAGIR